MLHQSGENDYEEDIEQIYFLAVYRFASGSLFFSEQSLMNDVKQTIGHLFQ